MARCAECGFVYLSEAPEYTALDAEFEWNDSYNREQQRRRERWFAPISRTLKRMRRALFRPRHPMAYVERHMHGGRLLDIGCSHGKRLGPTATGTS